jgi:hypothetical protein
METDMEIDMEIDTEIELNEENLNKELHDKLLKTNYKYKEFNLYENYIIYNINKYNYNENYISNLDDDILRRNLKKFFICLYEKIYLYNVVIIGYTSINDQDCYFYIVKEYSDYIQLEYNYLFYSDTLYSVINFLVSEHKKLILTGLTENSIENSIDNSFNNLTI